MRGHIAGRHVIDGQRHFGRTAAARAFVTQRQLGDKIAARQQRKIPRHLGLIPLQVKLDRTAIHGPAAPGPGISVIDHHPLRPHPGQGHKGRVFKDLVKLIEQFGQCPRLPDRPGRGPESHGKRPVRRPVQRNLWPGQSDGLGQNLPPEQQPARRQGRLHHRHPGQFAAIDIAQGHVDHADLWVQISSDRDSNLSKSQRTALEQFGRLRLDPVFDPAGGGDFLPHHQKPGDQGKDNRGQQQQQGESQGKTAFAPAAAGGRDVGQTCLRRSLFARVSRVSHVGLIRLNRPG